MTSTTAEKMDALTLALVLSITAPDDEKGDECARMAEGFAAGLTDEQIETCKARALAEVEAGSQGASLAARLSPSLH